MVSLRVCAWEDGRTGHDLSRKAALMYLCVSVRRVSETEREKEGKEEGALNVDVLGRGVSLWRAGGTEGREEAP